MILSKKKIIKNNLGSYHRVLETKKHIYYVNFDECDDNSNVMMFDRRMRLISNNYFANEGLKDDVEAKNYTWMSDLLKNSLPQ